MRSVGLDIGQRTDHPALVSCVALEGGRRLIEQAEQWPKGVIYPRQVDRILRVTRPDDLLVIDVTGVGRGPYDMVVDAGRKPWAVTITGGKNTHFNKRARTISIPKVALIELIGTHLSQHKLGVSGDAADAVHLRNQLENFQRVQKPNGRVTMGAKKGHDDLVLALALSLLGFYLAGLTSDDRTPASVERN